jgi:hypothetical protein
MLAEMKLHERTDIKLQFQDACSPSVLITTPKVISTGLAYTPANYVLISPMFLVFYE